MHRDRFMKFTLQKATLWKRFSALLFDIILTAILIVGFCAVTSLIVGYDQHNAKLSARYEYFETEYGVQFDISDEEFEKLSDMQKGQYELAKKALAEDKEIQTLYKQLFTKTLVILTVGCFLGVLVWDFIIPLFLKNGQTLGKKIFGTAVIRTNGVKITTQVLFIRAMIGTFAFETMFPILLVAMIFFGLLGSVGIITLALFYILQIGVICATYTNSAIHDMLCDTVVVDFSSQLIFENEEERVEFIRRQQEEEELAALNQF